MLNLFYQNKSLNDTLMINVSNAPISEIKTIQDVTIGYSGNKISFINIANISQKISKKFLADGLIFPTKELLECIKLTSGHDLSQEFNNGFRIGLIEKCEEIPGTHLHKCVVDLCDCKLNIVCGAPNAREGIKVVVATNGTMLPNGKQIISGELLGNKSEGMLCSYRELNIDKESNGIIELDPSAIVGNYYNEAYKNLQK